MSSLDELDKVARERLIGSPPHDFQHLGTLEKLNYVGTVGRVSRMGTIAQIGTVLLTIHVGTVHKIDRLGTLDEMTRAGTLNRIAGGRVGTLGRLGTVHYVERIGSISNLGSISRIGTVNRIGGGRIGTLGRLGSVHYIQRIGTISHVGSVGRIGTAHTGTVPVNVAAQDIMLGVDAQARYYSPISMRGTSPRLGCGSLWTGSWYAIDRYRVKSLMFHPAGSAPGQGSLAMIGGMSGTGENEGTFTYYPWTSIPKGSAGIYSFEEALMYIRPKFRQHGGPAGSWQPESGGTLQVHLGRQA